uniref:Uncharacterized protein n=1 Tax=Arundo donax TaxID=35708 RepID=A0A0A9E9X2_ARUDO
MRQYFKTLGHNARKKVRWHYFRYRVQDFYSYQITMDPELREQSNTMIYAFRTFHFRKLSNKIDI